MENQHRKIIGYRDLSQEEIDLMNRIKAKGEQVRALVDELRAVQSSEETRLANNEMHMTKEGVVAADADLSDARRWTSIAQTHLQQGFMALVRAVARPGSF